MVHVDDYEYTETVDQETRPEGTGWEYWSDAVTPEGRTAVWRRVRQDEGDEAQGYIMRRS